MSSETKLNIKQARKKIIKELNDSSNKDSFKYNNSDSLFNLGLSMYSGNNSIDSAIYCAYAASYLDSKISLHPEQIRIIKAIYNNKALVISAPTSFGKTYCVFEYIAREKPRNIVLIVPTLALTREYLLVFAKNHADLFSSYKIHTSVDEGMNYNFYDNNNIFILTHDRVTSLSAVSLIEKIDFLVVDEVYKLDSGMEEDDRTLVFNIAYAHLAKKAEKYVLLAPFIGGVKNCDQLDKKPLFVKSSFSPVVNEVEYLDIDMPSQRFFVIDNLLTSYGQSKTLVYFPGPTDIEQYVDQILVEKPNVTLSGTKLEFARWAENEIHPEWSVVKALKKGYLIHHGKLPSGVRDYLLMLFNKEDSENNILLCTSTLLEGVNTTAEKLIISKPNKISMKPSAQRFRSFDFYNLVGRTGRLNKYFIGYTCCLRESNDPFFDESDAEVTISFEITENSKDIDIQLNSASNNQEILNYLKEKGMTIDEYINEIGTPIRFEKFKKIREKYEDRIDELKNTLISGNDTDAFRVMNGIVRLKGDSSRFGIVKNVLQSRNKRTKDIIDTVRNFDSMNGKTIDEVASEVLRIKNGYLEHTFLTRCKIIKMFLKKDNDSEALINRIDNCFIRPIEEMYYLNTPYKKMLKSLGIYDSDIDIIINVIGSDYQDINELKNRLATYRSRYYNAISFISRFAIDYLIY